jgi:hypothetical protein
MTLIMHYSKLIEFIAGFSHFRQAIWRGYYVIGCKKKFRKRD